MVAIRSFIFAVGYILTVAIYGTIGLLTAIVPALTRHRIIVTWCSFTVKWLRLTCGVRYEITGLENFDKTKGPYVILSKHQSQWETLMLQRVFWPASTILKKELLDIPFFGWGLKALRPIPIDRSNPREALKKVKTGGIERLQSGLNLLLFPEGTRIPPGEKGKYARSGADIAITQGVNVIPVAVNAGHCWPNKGFKRYPGLISVVIGQPIITVDRTSREVTDIAENWIESELKKIEQKQSD